MENCNFALDDDKKPEALFCFAISAKRYALFNLDADGKPVIRKASAHGLGHMLPPYGEREAPQSIPAPKASLRDIGVERWQYDLWHQILVAALSGTPDKVPLDYHPALKLPAVSRFGITSPRLAKWMEPFNAGKDYCDQARPFGFMTQPIPRKKNQGGEELQAGPTKRGRPKRLRTPKPIAPFDKVPAKAAARAFDRETGEPVRPERLRTYAEALAQYHLGTEDKFLNANYLDTGRTDRRYVIATAMRLIGKEGNRLEDQPLLTPEDEVAAFGNASAHRTRTGSIL